MWKLLEQSSSGVEKFRGKNGQGEFIQSHSFSKLSSNYCNIYISINTTLSFMILLWCYYRPESSFTPFSFSLIREDQPSPTGRHVRPLHLADDDHDDDDHNRGDVDDDDCGDIDDDGGDVRSFQVSEEWFAEPDFRLLLCQWIFFCQHLCDTFWHEASWRYHWSFLADRWSSTKPVFVEPLRGSRRQDCPI